MNNLSKKAISISAILGLLLGIGVAALMMHAAWDHNPQCEIHCNGEIHWGYWVGIGFSWLVAVGVGFFLIFGVVPAYTIELVSRLRAKNTN